MGKTQAAATIAVMLALAFGAGYLVGSGVSAGRADGELERAQEQLGRAQEESRIALEQNRELAERQRSAQAIIARAAGTLAVAAGEAADIIELAERNIVIIGELEQIYQLLGAEAPEE